MTGFFRSIQIQLFQALKIGPIFIFLLIGSGCQFANNLSPTATIQPPALPTTPAGIELTPLASPANPSPAPTGTEPAPVLPPADPSPTLTGSAPAPALSPEGTWLIYGKQSDVHQLVMVNPDGTGLTSIALSDDCNFDSPPSIEADPLNRIADLFRNVYLIQPFKNKLLLAYSPRPSSCNTAFSGDITGGMLAQIPDVAQGAVPELIIYDLPGGKVRSRFPLVKCASGSQCDFSDVSGPHLPACASSQPGDWSQCDFSDVSRGQLRWSPNGRYLAFPAIWSGTSTDLYVYDSKDGSTRQLTNGPDRVAQLWWSPDGTRIIMGEISQASHFQYPFTTSIWVVSVNTDNIHLQYSLANHPFPQGILGWLDNEKFIVYDGTSLDNALDSPASNLRLVDIGSDKIQTVFNGSFMAAKMDAASQTIMLYGNHNGEDYPRAYLVSIGDYTVRSLGDFQPEWDEATRLFASNFPCKDSLELFQVFDFNGRMQCLGLPLRLEHNPSPDGQWQVWLTAGEGPRLIKTQDKSIITVIVMKSLNNGVLYKDESKSCLLCSDNTATAEIAL